jgi:hypothetical protein
MPFARVWRKQQDLIRTVRSKLVSHDPKFAANSTKTCLNFKNNLRFFGTAS